MGNSEKIYYSVDCEVDGPAPPLRGSMFWFGCVRVDKKLDTTFDGRLHPVSEYYEPKRLAVSNLTREDTLRFPPAELVMPAFVAWILATCDDKKPVLISDNNGFDAGLMNIYLWVYANDNPLGYSSRNIQDLYRGLKGDINSSFHHLIKTVHDHNPVNDAIGHAEAFIVIAPELGINI